MPDSLLGALQLTAIDMLVVFAVLALLALVIKGTESVVGRFDGRAKGKEDDAHDQPEFTEVAELEPEPEEREPVKPVAVPTAAPETNGQTPENARLVVVLAAAVAGYIGEARYAIRSIRPVEAYVTQDAWLVAGRERLIQSRNLLLRRR